MAREVELTARDGVARIVLARADGRNQINPQWVDALSEAVKTCADSRATRAVLLCAQGPAFTVGGDLQHLTMHLDSLSSELDSMVTGFHDALLRLSELPVPVLTAAHGAIAGGGLGLLWCADIVLLADDARLATSFSRIGLSSDGGSSWYLPRLIGARRAAELMIEGRILTASEAHDWGLVNRVVPRDQLEAEADHLAGELAAGPTRAYAEMRRLIRGAFETTLREGLDAERDAMVRLGDTEDAPEGITAFLEHRPACFRGR